ncbi:MAG: vanadium-dependent haloperoxidase [Pyrinomonadaceae bacterium]
MNKSVPPNRRQFIGRVGSVTAASIAASAIGIKPLLGTDNAEASAIGPPSNQRALQAFNIRRDAAIAARQATPSGLQHPTNPDDDLYPNKIGSYSKGLPHNANGEVNINAYNSLIHALTTGNPADFNAIPMGTPAGASRRKLVSPQSGLAFDIEGPDSHSLIQPPAPALASPEEGADIAENYWMALLRDVPFSQYDSNPIAQDAAADLNLFGSAFKGPKRNGKNQLTGVTTANLFRGLTLGDLRGPYLSQFFLLPCNFGANGVNQQIRTSQPGINYITDFAKWLEVQNGFAQGPDALDPVLRYMRNGRDIGQWVHIDVLFQAYFQAFLVLAGLGAPFDNNNPYRLSPSQDGFATFGGPHIATLLCEVSTRALHAVWYQKWFVHRRLRPEVFAERCDRRLTVPGNTYPIDSEILNSLQSATRLGKYFNGGNFFLPQAFPEGSPLHPSYGAGHATVAGACVTILKAWFRETTRITDLLPHIGRTAPVVASDDGLSLLDYTGTDAADLTVGGELNKIASNVANGRNIAGVHWRTDAIESLKLGEAIAISLLTEQRPCYNETFNGFSLTKFDGTTITV